MEGIELLLSEHGWQTSFPHARQLCLSRFIWDSLSDVEFHVKGALQQEHLFESLKLCHVGGESTALRTSITSQIALK